MSDPATPEERLAGARVSPAVPLSLLEALRSTDTPREVLEDEDVQQSLPRRLGLSDAVDAQIRRYRELQERKAWLGPRELSDLLVLVARRPDAASVFERAGEGLARRSLASGRLRAGLASFPLPRPLRRRLALRTARRVARMISPGAEEVRTELDPAALIVTGSLTAECGAPGACRMVGGALRAAFSLHSVPSSDVSLEVVHPLCEGRDDRCCVWRPEA